MKRTKFRSTFFSETGNTATFDFVERMTFCDKLVRHCRWCGRGFTTISILGVTITNHLFVSEHVSTVITKSAQSLHALDILSRHETSADYSHL